MKKDEIIELLKEQIKELRDDNNRLLGQIDDLIKEVSSLKEALLQKGESLSKQQRLAKGLAKLVSNTSEQQQAPQPAMSEEERQKREAEKADKRKARKNNGAKRDMHYEMEQEEHDVYPNDPDFDINKARLVTTAPEYVSAMNVYPYASSSTSTRYTPMRKTVVSLRERHRSRLS